MTTNNLGKGTRTKHRERTYKQWEQKIHLNIKVLEHYMVKQDMDFNLATKTKNLLHSHDKKKHSFYFNSLLH